MSGSGARRPRSRVFAMVERRSSLVRLLVALFVVRIVVTVTEVAESELTVWSAVVTAAIGVEAWRAWRVRRLPQVQGAESAPLPDTSWNRILTPLERHGPVVLYALSVVYAAGFIALLAAGESRDTLLTVAQVSRELITLFFLGVLVAGYLSVRGGRDT